MTSIDNAKPKSVIRDIIDKWHKREDGAQFITGDISDIAKDRLARELEIVFCSQSEPKEIVKDNLAAPKRGRPPHVDR